MNRMSGYGNNSRSTAQLGMKIAIVAFLGLQAIRQLVLVNAQADDEKESLAGQVAAWMTITLTVVVAGFLWYPSLPDKMITTGLLTLFVGAMGSGVAMLYDSIKNKAGPEKNRMWFAIAHIVFAILILAFLIYNFLK